NSTVPCIICHGPMHNISKPDNSTAASKFRNNNTETEQCTACHSSYQKHSNSVNCTVCHSDDVHDIQVFAQNGTYIELNKSNPNPARGNCTNCHQNASFLLDLTNLTKNPKAGYHDNISLPAPQIPKPMNHSDDINAGRKWNQTPGYWTNGTSGSAQNSSCFYCHGRTMHNTSALGRPSLFQGNNVVNSTISSSTFWCASCHYQLYSNGTKNYNDTVSTFNFPYEPLLVPPEITKNASFGANQSISAYFDHSGFSTYADSKCDECHPTSSTTITAFMHNVPVGSAGDVNCTNCHRVGGSQNNVNFTALNLSIHANLNKNATGNATNKPCWGCHGTKNGTYANESDQPIGQHNATQYKNPRKCYDCHITGILQFNAVNVTDHVPSGYTSL
ncbi:MAG: hypothetical protein Q8N79_02340, partial [Candidatus Methanoperedens sp.]|nr:hypothetical protein [Candidatus Methanoperedens sp.]